MGWKMGWEHTREEELASFGGWITRNEADVVWGLYRLGAGLHETELLGSFGFWLRKKSLFAAFWGSITRNGVVGVLWGSVTQILLSFGGLIKRTRLLASFGGWVTRNGRQDMPQFLLVGVMGLSLAFFSAPGVVLAIPYFRQ